MAPTTTKKSVHEFVEDRLERIEDKVDKLGEAIVALARVEENLKNQEKSNGVILENMVHMNRRLDDTDKKVVFCEEQIRECLKTNSNLKRFIWIVITALVTALAAGWHKFAAVFSSPPSN